MPEITATDVTSFLSTLDITKLLAGVPLDWNLVPQKLDVIKMMTHCCINGPVGVGKLTNFPDLTGQFKIKDHLGPQKVSNKSWRKACAEAAKAIKVWKPDLQCQQKTLKGDLWPLYEPDV